ncbi:WD40 repeat-like protein [Auriscalpium vulgare]|uniref:WD40 repeat-like protein n=1 Tax=Auriscalpium vulgare TaxID=40419 RepID=A0ACB8RJ75_9AGAM|nr:WD40 repeat-like protein [Auriscalpium vulgare]
MPPQKFEFDRYTSLARARTTLLDSQYERGFTYFRRLTAHTSCVNALAFSSGEGRWLASAGDDRSTCIWDLHQENVTEPSSSFFGHRANVFTLAFSASNRYLFSGGADDAVYQYDFMRESTRRSGPLRVYARHVSDIRAVSCHPSQDEVFMSASQDGSIMLHDGRASRAQCTLQQTYEFSGVQYHPTLENLFLTSDSMGHVYLRDVRMAFGPLHERANSGVVQQYVTNLTRRSDGRCARPDVGSVTFDSEGKKLAVSFLHYLPTIYALSDPYPLATCSGRNFPGGNPPPPGVRTYSNSATIKHGSFGGPGRDGDGYFSSGSDDFRGYLWKIPPLEELKRMRETVSADEWVVGEVESKAVGFASGSSDDRHVPVELPTPLFHLKGHKSIVNTTLIHPVYPLIVTSGIERHVFMHSPTPTTPFSCELERTPADVRALPGRSREGISRILRVLVGDDDRELEESREHPLGEDGLSISFFDEILRQEGEGDVFHSRGAMGNDSSDDESDEEIGNEENDDPAAEAIMADISDEPERYSGGRNASMDWDIDFQVELEVVDDNSSPAEGESSSSTDAEL